MRTELTPQEGVIPVHASNPDCLLAVKGCSMKHPVGVQGWYAESLQRKTANCITSLCNNMSVKQLTVSAHIPSNLDITHLSDSYDISYIS